MSRTMETILKLSGEAEYRQALKSCESELKLLKSDLDVTASTYQDNANSMLALTEKGEGLQKLLDKQKEKLSILRDALEDAKEAQEKETRALEELNLQYEEAERVAHEYGKTLGENSDEYRSAVKHQNDLKNAVISHNLKLSAASKDANYYQSQINKASIEVNKLNAQIKENNRYLDEARSSTDGCAHSIDQYGKRVKETARELDDAEEKVDDFADALDDVDTDDLSFGDVLGAEMIAEGAEAILEKLGDVMEETREYRRTMASLKESSQDAGYSAGETSQEYGKLNGVLGDTQAAATTTANLQALGQAQGKLLELTDGVIGAWAKYGDSIPIDGLSEAVDHTAKLGEVQGNLADVLEWAGIPVEDFNAQLAACGSLTERANLISQLFADQGLTALGRSWQENNRSLIESNNAAAAMQEQLARLAETLEPIFTGLTNAGARMLRTINDGLDALAGHTAADDLASSMDGFRQSMQGAALATDQTRASTESSVFMAQQYVERLTALEQAGLGTAESQREYAATVELLNELVPGLNLAINEQTGLIDQSTGTVLANIDAWKQQSMAKAIQTEITAQLDAQSGAYLALQRAEKDKIALDAREAELLKRLEDAQKRAGTQTGRMTSAMQLGSIASDSLSGALTDMGNQALGITDEMAELERELAQVRSEQGYLDEQIDASKGLIAESEEAINSTREAYGEFAEAARETGETASGSAETMSDAIAENAAVIMESYNSMKESARQSIDSQIGLFDDLSEKCDMSGQEMIEALAKQRQAFENYADNIKTAVARGIDIGLVQKLSDGSQESMQQLAVLVEMSEEEIDKLNENFRGVEDAKDALAEGMTAVSDEFLAQLVEMGKLTEEEAYNMGLQLVNGLVRGVNDKAPTYNETVGNLARGGQYTYQTIQDQHSPSRRFREFAKNDVDGLVVEYQAQQSNYEKAAGNLAESGYQAMVQARRESSAILREDSLPELPISRSGPAQTMPGGAGPDLELPELLRSFEGLMLAQTDTMGALSMEVERLTGELLRLSDRAASLSEPARSAPAQDERIYPMLQQMLTAIEAGHAIVLYPDVLVGATAGSYNRAFGSMQMLTDRGVQ
ncbi:MAG: hypothetical protein IJ960_00915 [Oscillospiraceae bacterium]|nr:hypothetical protein [Oscillospiraceae bacterium]